MLLDTNVWLDYYLPWRGGHAVARQLIERALEDNRTLAYAVSTVKDVYYMVAAEHKRAERAAAGSLSDSAAQAATATAWGCINNMQAIACAVPLDHTDVWMAAKQRALHGDFEDDLVIASAMRGRTSAVAGVPVSRARSSACPATWCRRVWRRPCLRRRDTCPDS